MGSALDADVMTLPACPRCAHLLVGIANPRCPECGSELLAEDWADLNRLIACPPWELRRYYGQFRSYLRTLFAFLLRPRGAMRSLQGPAHVRDAVVFWLCLIPVAWVLALILFLPIDIHENWPWLNRERIVDMIFVVGVRCATL